LAVFLCQYRSEMLHQATLLVTENDLAVSPNESFIDR
jgi:hypothetical protein